MQGENFPLESFVELKSLILEDLSQCAQNSPEIIVEVAHPDLTR